MVGPTRLQNRQQAAQRRKDLVARLAKALARHAPGAASRAPSNAPAEAAPTVPANTILVPTGQRPDPQPAETPQPWRHVKAGDVALRFALRHDPGGVTHLQPWTKKLVNELLAAACEGSTRLCLVWPGTLTGVAALHGIAALCRLMRSDLQGLRTLLYPGTNASGTQLQSLLVDPVPVTTMYRGLWKVPTGKGATELHAATTSVATQALLDALNALRNHAPQQAWPSLAEAIPVFVADKGRWGTSVGRPLERSLRKVPNIGHRKSLRAKVHSQWSELARAPNALLVMHANNGKSDWKRALQALARVPQPEVLLLDATQRTALAHDKASRRLVEFASFVREQHLSKVGALIVTDDPKTYFVLRSALTKHGIPVTSTTLATEGSDILVGAEPYADEWMPALRSNSRFEVGIVDRDAASVAAGLVRVAHKLGDGECNGFNALMGACQYVLSVSNVSAGLVDFVDAAQEGELTTFQNPAWHRIELARHAAYADGSFGSLRHDADRALYRATQLVDAWADATPLARKVLGAVEHLLSHPKARLALVLRSTKHLLLAHRYLRRKLGDAWASVEKRVDWHTEGTLAKHLDGAKGEHTYVFAGANPNSLRVLLVEPHMPHGAHVYLTYRQADSLVHTLRSMKAVDALKPYRGRIGLLLQGLEQQLAQVPNHPDLNALAHFSLEVPVEDLNADGDGGEAECYRFDLEGGRRAYASGFVYRYEADEDPCFRRVSVREIHPDMLIFDMTDELRGKIEEALHVNGEAAPLAAAHRTVLDLYHGEVKRRSELFPAHSIGKRAAAIHKRMSELDAGAGACSVERVRYWLDIGEGKRPHASKDWMYFKLFCEALGITNAPMYWAGVTKSRTFNQALGRWLAARYAEILFRHEDAATYRRVPNEVIKRLQQEALGCVFRVENVHEPQ